MDNNEVLIKKAKKLIGIFKIVYILIIALIVVGSAAGMVAFLGGSSVTETFVSTGNIIIIILASIFLICLVSLSIKGFIVNFKLKKDNKKNDTLEIMSFSTIGIILILMFIM